MYHRMRRKLQWKAYSAILIIQCLIITTNTKNIYTTKKPYTEDPFDNMIDFEDEYDIKFDKKYGVNPNWNVKDDLNKEMHRYSIVDKEIDTRKTKEAIDTTTDSMSVIPLELLSTTENALISLLESTTEQDLTVIPLSTTKRAITVEVTESFTLPSSTENELTTTDMPEEMASTLTYETTEILETKKSGIKTATTTENVSFLYKNKTTTEATVEKTTKTKSKSRRTRVKNTTESTIMNNKFNKTRDKENKTEDHRKLDMDLKEIDVPLYTALDFDESVEVPEDYYDTKDVLPTKVPSNDALSVIFGLAGSVVESVVESVAEKVVPRGLFDLFKRMQKQSEALEAEKLRSREENGGLGQFGRGILKTISTGLSRPFNQLMAGVKDIGSLDNDRSFVSSVVSGVTNVANVANTLADSFKDRVQAIYPGTLWCGDGHVAQARSSDLGLFFFTDTCCRQHDACKIYIRAGDTKYGLTNTGLFTRSHCSCDKQFRECLQKTKSLVSGQIGLTYFNVLGPQCFRKAHPIVKCLRRTRLTGQKCEEYEFDYTKPKIWQWFDNETY